jgi:hypothetical protein
MAGAYFLWLFFGFIGAHRYIFKHVWNIINVQLNRWYTGHCTVSTFFVWLITFQLFGLGWLYDMVHTATMVREFKPASKEAPFYIKAYDGKYLYQSSSILQFFLWFATMYDYVPINSNTDLQAVINTFLASEDIFLRIVGISWIVPTIDFTNHYTVKPKISPSVTSVLWLFFGMCAAHHSYLGLNRASCALKCLTCNYGSCGYLCDGIQLNDLIEEASI